MTARLKRVLRRAATVTMLMVACMFALGWVRSYWVFDHVSRVRVELGDEGPYTITGVLEAYNGGIVYLFNREGPLQREDLRPAMMARVGTHWKTETPPPIERPWTPRVGRKWEHFAGFAWGSIRGTTYSPPGYYPTFWLNNTDYYVVPYWFLTSITGIPPIVVLTRKWIVRQRHRRWQRLGLCVQCGYDVRRTSAGPALTDDVQRCPECGFPYVPALSCPAQPINGWR